MHTESCHKVASEPERLLSNGELMAVIKKVRGGDTDAFAPVIRAYGSKVQLLAFRIVHDWEEARDITQDAFLSAFQHLHQFKPQTSFQSWLSVIVSRKAIDHLRKRKSRPVLHQEQPGIEKPDEVSSSVVLNRELNSEIERAIRELPDEQRIAITLSVYENLSTVEIAESLNVSRKSAEMHVYRARNALREKLKGFL